MDAKTTAWMQQNRATRIFCRTGRIHFARTLQKVHRRRNKSSRFSSPLVTPAEDWLTPFDTARGDHLRWNDQLAVIRWRLGAGPRLLIMSANRYYTTNSSEPRSSLQYGQTRAVFLKLNSIPQKGQQHLPSYFPYHTHCPYGIISSPSRFLLGNTYAILM